MKSVLVRLKEYEADATPTEKVILGYILEHPEEVQNMTIYELAVKTFSSPASIIRLCKKNGFKGFKDLIRALVYENAIRKHSKKEEQKELIKSDSLKDIVDKVTYKNIVSLEDTKNILDMETLDKCIELLIKCENICIYGIGSSLIVAKDAQQKFLRLNRNCTVSEDWHLQLLTARNMSPKDLGIIISYSGQTSEMIECAKAMKANGVKTISITRYGISPVVNLCDYNIFIAANESTFRSGAMSSRISQLNVIDILYTAYASHKHEDTLELISRTHIRKEHSE